MVWLLIVTVGVSYGWGMRGTLIGHGKGAMVPGAILGMCVAFLSGNAVLADNWLILAALGAAGMFFGGGMTYGQTIGLVIDKYPAPHFWRGALGLSLKGFLWFGIAGAFLGMGAQAVFGGVYSAGECVAAALLPAALFPLGVRLFNRPHDAEKGIFPKPYFSKTRPECWGGYLLILAELCVFAAVKGDRFTLVWTAFAALGGGIGWFVAILFYYVTHHPLKNGRYLLGSMQRNGLIDNWKIMECTLGAIGGLAAAAGFLITRAHFGAFAEMRVLLSSRTAELVLVGVWVALVALDIWLQASRFADKYGDGVEQVIYGCVPLALVMLGSTLAASLCAGMLVLWVVVEKMCFESLKDYRGIALLTAVSLAAVAAFGAAAFAGWAVPVWVYVAVYTAVYELLTLAKDFRPKKFASVGERGFARTFGSVITVNLYFIVTIAVFCALFFARI